MGRAPCCEKVGLRKGRWTEEEDEKLANYIQANGEGSWRSLPKNAGLLRCGKSCRLRWINYLRADLKRGNISAEEEETIVKLHTSLGNRWSVIAAQLPGRTDNEIKNYWNSHLGRRIHSFRRANGDGAMTVIMDLGKMVGIPCKRRGGRTSRSAMQKNTTVVPIAKGRHDQGGAMLPSNRDQTETGGSPRGDDMKSSCPPCGEPLDGPVVDTHGSRMPAHDEPLDGEMFDCDQLLPSELWETTRAMASELFGPSDQGMEGGFWGGWGCPEEGESGGWGAVSLLSEERGSGATMSASSTSDDRENVPTPAWGEERDRQGGAGEAAPGASAAGHPRGEAEECNSAVTVDRWVDAELEEMATKLWDEVGEAWPWQWEVPGDGDLDLRQPCMDGSVYEEVALDSLFL